MAQSLLSYGQQLLLQAVQSYSYRNVEDCFQPEYIEKNDNWFDYILLVTALKRKHKMIINFLLKKDCRVRRETGTDSFHTPLHYAVILGDIKIIRKLLKKGASITDKNLTDKTPLHLAVLGVHQENFDIVDLMLVLSSFENINPNNNDDIVHFHIACMRDKYKIVRKFVDSGFSINTGSVLDIKEWLGFTPLHFAFENKSNVTSIYLLNKNADLSIKNAKGWTPLQLAHYHCLFIYIPDALDLALSLHERRYINPVDDQGLSHFLISCTRNVPKSVEIFINNKVDINSSISLAYSSTSHYPGYTGLHFAIRRDCIDVVELLLRKGARVNQTAKDELTPLHLACEINRIDIAKLLMKYDASINAIGNKGRTPLHCAFYAIPKSDVLIDLLLQRIPKNVNVTDSRGLSHFHIACTRNNLSVVQDFLHCGVAVDSCINSDEGIYSGYTALHLAVNYNRKDVVKLLLQHRANVDIGITSSQIRPLHLACTYTQDKCYETADAYKREPNNEIDWAPSRNSQIAIVKLLLQHNADVNVRDSCGKTPLMHACEININNGSYNKINSLNFYDIQEFRNILSQELSSRQKEIIDILLLNYANIRYHTNNNESILHLIIANSTSAELTAELAKFLLTKGAVVDAINSAGKTPLHLAIKHFKPKFVEVLLSHNANVNARTNEQMTPLHLAVKVSRSWPEIDPIVEILLKNGSDIHAQNERGDTPLHMAFSDKKDIAIEQLLRCGADVNRENATGCPTITGYYRWRINFQYANPVRYRTMELIEVHLKKLVAIGFYVSNKVKENYFQLFGRNDLELPMDSDDVFVKCTRELEKMKSVKIDNYWSLYDILFKDQNEMVQHVKNEGLHLILMGDGFESEFPLYGYLLKLQFKKGMLRSTFLKPAKDSLGFITGLNLPDSCSESILRHLINSDLKKLIEANSSINCLKRKLDVNVEKNDKKQQRSE